MPTPLKPSTWRLALTLFSLSTLIACTGPGPSPNDIGGTAQSLAQTAAAGGQQAGTAAAGAAATLAAKATEMAPTTNALATKAINAVATAATAAAQVTPPDVADEAAATAAITQYAEDVLGISVNIIKAGGLTADIQRMLKLPQAGDAAQDAATKAAVETYAALLDRGAASVSYGSGTVAGDLTIDINSSSVGAFSFDAGTVPGSRAEALELAKQTFPGIADRSFTAFPVQQGYAWLAQGNVPGYDRATGQASLVAEAVLLAVTPGIPLRSAVSVVVGKGDFAGQVAP
jgi:hypothetical protein